MKYLIIANSRPGVKFLQQNLLNYIDSTYTNSLYVESDMFGNRLHGIQELLNPVQHTMMGSKVSRNENKLRLVRDPLFIPQTDFKKSLDDQFPEFVNRTETLKCEYPWSASFFSNHKHLKYHKTLFKEILPIADRIFILLQNQFDAALSLQFSAKLHGFYSFKEPIKKAIIESLLAYPITIKEESFLLSYKRLLYFYHCVVPVITELYSDKVTIVDYEKLTNVSTNTEFTELLGLENKDFALQSSSRFKSGNQLMTRNVEELKKMCMDMQGQIYHDYLPIFTEFSKSLRSVR